MVGDVMTAKTPRTQGICASCDRTRMLDRHDLCSTCRQVVLVPDGESPTVLDPRKWVPNGHGGRRYVGRLT